MKNYLIVKIKPVMEPHLHRGLELVEEFDAYPQAQAFLAKEETPDGTYFILHNRGEVVIHTEKVTKRNVSFDPTVKRPRESKKSKPDLQQKSADEKKTAARTA